MSPAPQTVAVWLASDANIYLRAVPIYTPKQIAGIRKACLLARQILDKAHAAVRPGITTDEIDKVVSARLTSLFVQAAVHLTTATALGSIM
jgi:methionine aminopeptidase